MKPNTSKEQKAANTNGIKEHSGINATTTDVATLMSYRIRAAYRDKFNSDTISDSELLKLIETIC